MNLQDSALTLLGAYTSAIVAIESRDRNFTHVNRVVRDLLAAVAAYKGCPPNHGATYAGQDFLVVELLKLRDRKTKNDEY